MRKNAAVGYARLLAMIMILLCHYCQFFDLELAWWFNVDVQVFFIISGFLYGQRRIEDPVAFIQRRFGKIMTPFWIYLMGVTAFLIIFDKEAVSVSSIIGALSGAKPYSGVEHLWFIPYIMFCYLITPLLDSLKARIEKQDSFFRCLWIVILIPVAELFYRMYGFYFRPSRVACYIVGYIYAIQINDWRKDKRKQAVASYVLIVIALIMNAIRVYCKYYYPSKLVGTALSLFDLFEQYSHVALGLAIFVGCLELFKNAKYNAVLELSDKYSFYIYIVHHIIVNSKYSVFVWISNIFFATTISVALIALSGTVLYYITTKVEKIDTYNILRAFGIGIDRKNSDE